MSHISLINNYKNCQDQSKRVYNRVLPTKEASVLGRHIGDTLPLGESIKELANFVNVIQSLKQDTALEQFW